MRCVLITNNYPPVVDGVGDYTFLLANELRKNGSEVYLICKSKGGHTYLDENGIPVYPIVTSWTLRGFKEAFSTIAVLKPKCIIWQYVPYAFHKRGLPFGLLFICFVLRMKGYTLITMFHEVATRLYEVNLKKIAVSLAQLTIAQGLAIMSRFNLTSTRFNKKQVPLSNMKLIPIPSNFVRGDQILGTQVSKRENSRIKIGCFANRVDDFFAQVLEEILKDNRFEVVLMGKQNENYFSVWDKYAFKENPRITITGVVNNAAMVEVFSQLNVFIHTEQLDHRGRGGASLKNGSLAAAFFWSLPVITSRGDMTDECLVDHENVLFVDPPGTVGAWVKAVTQLADDREFHLHIGANGHQLYEKNLTWDKVATTYSKLINSI